MELENLFWNPFGIGKPVAGGMHRIVAQINPSNGKRQGKAARSQGAFVRDGEHTLLAHAGKFTVGYQPMRLDQLGGKPIGVDGRQLIAIGAVGDPALIAQIAEFVRAVGAAKDAGTPDDEAESAGDEGDAEGASQPSYWKLAPERDGELWPQWRDASYASIGWEELGDLANVGRDEFVERCDAYLSDHPDAKQAGLEQVWRFAHIQPGARIVANRGTRRVLGIGTVVDPYHFDASTPHGHRLGVRWDDTRQRIVQRGGWRKTLISLSREVFDQVSAAPSPNSPVVHPLPLHTRGNLDFDGLIAMMEDGGLTFSEEIVAAYLLALQAKRFVLLSGISGTGKTKLAQFVARVFAVAAEVDADHGNVTVEGEPHELLVRPYMFKHNRLWLPVDLLEEEPALLERATDSDRSVTLTVAGNAGMNARLWRKADTNLVGLFWPKAVAEKFAATFRPGDRIRCEVRESKGKPHLLLEAAGKAMASAPARAWEVVAVRPDWTDNRGLLGFHNPLTGLYRTTPFLELVLAARDEEQVAKRQGRAPRPFFAILDEMNLARVEHYFSDFLSCIESGEPLHLHDDQSVEEGAGGSEPVPRRLSIPRNLFFTGTVNVDETTYMFSPKVLDRAFTLELDEVQLESFGADLEPGESEATSVLRLELFDGSLQIRDAPGEADWRAFRALLSETLAKCVLQLNDILKTEHRHFGYRSAAEIGRFVSLAAEQAGPEPDRLWAALDIALVAKVLPKLHGSELELATLLQQLRDTVAATNRLPRSQKKLARMQIRLQRTGHTSFIE
jgi:hypothetical protein